MLSIEKNSWALGSFFVVSVFAFSWFFNPFCSTGDVEGAGAQLYQNQKQHSQQCDKIPRRQSELLPVKCVTICPSSIEQHGTDWILNISQHASFINYSQRGSESMISYIFSNIGVTNRFFVEFGINHPQNLGSGSNTRYFWENCFWDGLLMDIDNDNPDINLHKEFITSSNIVSLFEKYGVPMEPDFVSIDIDSHDLWVFLGLTETYRPRLIQLEYNANFECDEALSVPDGDPPDTNLGLYGASFSALYLAGKDRGYTIVDADRADMFMLRDDLLPGLDVETLLPFWETWAFHCGVPTHVKRADLNKAMFFDYAPLSDHKIPDVPRGLDIAQMVVIQRKQDRIDRLAAAAARNANK